MANASIRFQLRHDRNIGVEKSFQCGPLKFERMVNLPMAAAIGARDRNLSSDISNECGAAMRVSAETKCRERWLRTPRGAFRNRDHRPCIARSPGPSADRPISEVDLE